MVLAILTTASASAIFQKVNIHGGLSISGEALKNFLVGTFVFVVVPQMLYLIRGVSGRFLI